MKNTIRLLFPLIIIMSLGACSSTEKSSSSKEPNQLSESSLASSTLESASSISSSLITSSSTNNKGYSPTFDSFAEVAYYSYMKEDASFFKGLSPKRRIDNKTNEEDDVRTDYVDEEGRLHYIIPYEHEYVFSEFLYFSFDMAENAFLKDKIGVGKINGLTVKTNAFDEKMIILKNGSEYFSCLYNGGSEDYITSKTLQFFEVVKDNREMKHIYLSFENNRNPTTLSSIEIDGERYDIDLESIHYDRRSVTCSINDLREGFNLSPDPRFDDYSEEPYSYSEDSSFDELLNLPPIQIEDVYSDHKFALEEFPDVILKIGPKVLNEDETLYVHPLYVNGVRVTEDTIDRLLFAYDVNKDGYRDLVFSENIEENGKKTTHINGFDIHNMKKMENKLGFKQYRMDLHIDGESLKARAYMASTISAVTFDYAELAYTEEKGLYFVWDNMYQFTDFKLNRITLNDENKTVIAPVINEAGVNYALHANTDYIFEIDAPREENPTIETFDFERQTGFDVKVGDDTLPVYKFQYQSSENDVHKYLVNFLDSTKEFVYTFTIPCMSFSINVTLVD